MALRFLPFTQDLEAAARAFNQRMKDKDAPTSFLLPESSVQRRASNGVIKWQHYVAMDDGIARGGVLLVDQPGWLNGKEVTAVNFQSPLSEGISDGQNVMVGAQIVKFIQKRSDPVFIVGMGSLQRPLPRMLQALGWTIQQAPFYFRVHNSKAFFRELKPLHKTGARSLAAKFAGVSGLGGLALGWKQRRQTSTPLTLTKEKAWGDWADSVWVKVRPHCTFAVRRDRETLEALYPPSDLGIKIFQAQQRGATIGVAVCLDTQMKNNRYFGNLRVATILDCLAEPANMPALAVAVDQEMGSRGVDLVVVNHTHSAWIEAFPKAGLIQGPSNYLCAYSRSLAKELAAIEGGMSRIHITRGDGDGRVNL